MIVSRQPIQFTLERLQKSSWPSCTCIHRNLGSDLCSQSTLMEPNTHSVWFIKALQFKSWRLYTRSYRPNIIVGIKYYLQADMSVCVYSTWRTLASIMRQARRYTSFILLSLMYMYKYVNRLNTICKPIFHYYLTLMSEVEGAGSLITVHTLMLKV